MKEGTKKGERKGKKEGRKERRASKEISTSYVDVSNVHPSNLSQINPIDRGYLSLTLFFFARTRAHARN